jgi:hypothetical protein
MTMASFDIEHVFFTPPVKNNLIDRGLFSRIIYSTPDYTVNGIYLKGLTRANLKTIETELLTNYRTKKTKCATLCTLPHYNWDSHFLKISGIWETETSVGIAFKFIHLSSET